METNRRGHHHYQSQSQSQGKLVNRVPSSEKPLTLLSSSLKSTGSHSHTTNNNSNSKSSTGLFSPPQKAITKSPYEKVTQVHEHLDMLKSSMAMIEELAVQRTQIALPSGASVADPSVLASLPEKQLIKYIVRQCEQIPLSEWEIKALIKLCKEKRCLETGLTLAYEYAGLQDSLVTQISLYARRRAQLRKTKYFSIGAGVINTGMEPDLRAGAGLGLGSEVDDATGTATTASLLMILPVDQIDFRYGFIAYMECICDLLLALCSYRVQQKSPLPVVHSVSVTSEGQSQRTNFIPSLRQDCLELFQLIVQHQQQQQQARGGGGGEGGGGLIDSAAVGMLLDGIHPYYVVLLCALCVSCKSTTVNGGAGAGGNSNSNSNDNGNSKSNDNGNAATPVTVSAVQSSISASEDSLLKGYVLPYQKQQLAYAEVSSGSGGDFSGTPGTPGLGTGGEAATPWTDGVDLDVLGLGMYTVPPGAASTDSRFVYQCRALYSNIKRLMHLEERVNSTFRTLSRVISSQEARISRHGYLHNTNATATAAVAVSTYDLYCPILRLPYRSNISYSSPASSELDWFSGCVDDYKNICMFVANTTAQVASDANATTTTAAATAGTSLSHRRSRGPSAEYNSSVSISVSRHSSDNSHNNSNSNNTADRLSKTAPSSVVGSPTPAGFKMAGRTAPSTPTPYSGIDNSSSNSNSNSNSKKRPSSGSAIQLQYNSPNLNPNSSSNHNNNNQQQLQLQQKQQQDQVIGAKRRSVSDPFGNPVRDSNRDPQGQGRPNAFSTGRHSTGHNNSSSAVVLQQRLKARYSRTSVQSDRTDQEDEDGDSDVDRVSDGCGSAGCDGSGSGSGSSIDGRSRFATDEYEQLDVGYLEVGQDAAVAASSGLGLGSARLPVSLALTDGGAAAARHLQQDDRYYDPPPSSSSSSSSGGGSGSGSAQQQPQPQPQPQPYIAEELSEEVRDFTQSNTQNNTLNNSSNSSGGSVNSSAFVGTVNMAPFSPPPSVPVSPKAAVVHSAPASLNTPSFVPGAAGPAGSSAIGANTGAGAVLTYTPSVYSKVKVKPKSAGGNLPRGHADTSGKKFDRTSMERMGVVASLLVPFHRAETRAESQVIQIALRNVDTSVATMSDLAVAKIITWWRLVYPRKMLLRRMSLVRFLKAEVLFSLADLVVMKCIHSTNLRKRLLLTGAATKLQRHWRVWNARFIFQVNRIQNWFRRGKAIARVQRVVTATLGAVRVYRYLLWQRREYRPLAMTSRFATLRRVITGYFFLLKTMSQAKHLTAAATAMPQVKLRNSIADKLKQGMYIHVDKRRAAANKVKGKFAAVIQAFFRGCLCRKRLRSKTTMQKLCMRMLMLVIWLKRWIKKRQEIRLQIKSGVIGRVLRGCLHRQRIAKRVKAMFVIYRLMIEFFKARILRRKLRRVERPLVVSLTGIKEVPINQIRADNVQVKVSVWSSHLLHIISESDFALLMKSRAPNVTYMSKLHSVQRLPSVYQRRISGTAAASSAPAAFRPAPAPVSPVSKMWRASRNTLGSIAGIFGGDGHGGGGGPGQSGPLQHHLSGRFGNVGEPPVLLSRQGTGLGAGDSSTPLAMGAVPELADGQHQHQHDLSALIEEDDDADRDRDRDSMERERDRDDDGRARDRDRDSMERERDRDDDDGRYGSSHHLPRLRPPSQRNHATCSMRDNQALNLEDDQFYNSGGEVKIEVDSEPMRRSWHSYDNNDDNDDDGASSSSHTSGGDTRSRLLSQSDDDGARSRLQSEEEVAAAHTSASSSSSAGGGGGEVQPLRPSQMSGKTKKTASYADALLINTHEQGNSDIDPGDGDGAIVLKPSEMSGRSSGLKLPTFPSGKSSLTGTAPVQTRGASSRSGSVLKPSEMAAEQQADLKERRKMSLMKIREAGRSIIEERKRAESLDVFSDHSNNSSAGGAAGGGGPSGTGEGAGAGVGPEFFRSKKPSFMDAVIKAVDVEDNQLLEAASRAALVGGGGSSSSSSSSSSSAGTDPLAAGAAGGSATATTTVTALAPKMSIMDNITGFGSTFLHSKVARGLRNTMNINFGLSSQPKPEPVFASNTVMVCQVDFEDESFIIPAVHGNSVLRFDFIQAGSNQKFATTTVHLGKHDGFFFWGGYMSQDLAEVASRRAINFTAAGIGSGSSSSGGTKNGDTRDPPVFQFKMVGGAPNRCANDYCQVRIQGTSRIKRKSALNYIFDTWTRYYMVLEGEELYAFQRKSNVVPLRTIPVKEIKLVSTENGYLTTSASGYSSVPLSVVKSKRNKEEEEFKLVGEDFKNVILHLANGDCLYMRFVDKTTRERWLYNLKNAMFFTHGSEDPFGLKAKEDDSMPTAQPLHARVKGQIVDKYDLALQYFASSTVGMALSEAVDELKGHYEDVTSALGFKGTVKPLALDTLVQLEANLRVHEQQQQQTTAATRQQQTPLLKTTVVKIRHAQRAFGVPHSSSGRRVPGGVSGGTNANDSSAERESGSVNGNSSSGAAANTAATASTAAMGFGNSAFSSMGGGSGGGTLRVSPLASMRSRSHDHASDGDGDESKSGSTTPDVSTARRRRGQRTLIGLEHMAPAPPVSSLVSGGGSAKLSGTAKW